MKLSPEEHRAIDRENCEPTARAARERTDELLDRIADLEGRLYMCGVLLESALELLDRRAAEHARTLELVATIVRCDEIIAANDDGPRLAWPRERHRSRLVGERRRLGGPEASEQDDQRWQGGRRTRNDRRLA